MKKEDNAVLQGLLDVKKEYQDYLCDLFSDSIIECFQRTYKECITKPEVRNGKNVLVVFQQELGNVHSWNQATIMDEYDRARKRSNCKYTQSLIKATLVVYVKIMLMTNYTSVDFKKINIRVPAAEAFYHRCIIIAAAEIWKQPYLMYHKVRSIEQQHNLNEIETIVKKSIKNAVRVFLPMDQLFYSLEIQEGQHDEGDDQVEEVVEDDDASSEALTQSEEDTSEEQFEEERKEDVPPTSPITEPSEDDEEEIHNILPPVESEETNPTEEDVRTVAIDEPKDVEPLLEEEDDDVATEPKKKIMLHGLMAINKDKIRHSKIQKIKPPIKLNKGTTFF
jgi:hypothetical protein